ncbi:MAG: alpha/beta hydrolase [Acidimicrobiia bacterium]|nr:alpha/beta hydrolase [Acidimicrobiia bacterium]
MNQGFVGADPAGLVGLARSAETLTIRIRAAGAVAAAILERRDWPHASAVIAGGLTKVAGDVQARADQLKWRAAKIQTAQDLQVCAPGGQDRDHLELAAFAALAIFDPGDRTDAYRRWLQPPSLESLAAMSPQQVGAALAVTAPSLQQNLARTHPEVIGALDGVPPELRFVANRILLARRIEELERQIEALRPTAGAAWARWIGSAWPVVWLPVSSLRSTTIRHMRDQIDRFQMWLDEDRQILHFDPTGDGRIVEVFGNLETAQRIAIVVPGMANDIDDFNGGLRANTNLLFESAVSFDPEVAAVAWLGYDTPDGADAALRDAATVGAPALQQFVRGIDPESEKVITVVAHSYGSVVAGIAARRGLDVNDLILLGSPGTTLDSRADAQLRPGGRIWAGLADDDPIASAISPAELPPWWLPAGFAPFWLAADLADGAETLWFGTNPAHESFGALRITTEGSRGHSSYFAGNSLQNLVRIMLGRYEDVVLED